MEAQRHPIICLLSISLLLGGVVESVGSDDSPVVQIADLGFTTSQVGLDFPGRRHHHLVSAKELWAVVDLETPSLGDHAVWLDTPSSWHVASLLATTGSHHSLLGDLAVGTQDDTVLSLLELAGGLLLCAEGWVRLVVLILGIVFLFVRHVTVLNEVLSVDKTVRGKRLLNLFHILDRVKVGRVDDALWLWSDDLGKNTVVKMLVELLSIGKSGTASRALASNVLVGVLEGTRRARRGNGSAATIDLLWSAIGCGLLNVVDGHQVPLEDIGAVECLLGWKTAARAETTDHGSLVMSESVALAIVLASEAFLRVFASGDWALLWALIHVGDLMGLQVSEDLATSIAKVISIGRVARAGGGSLRAWSALVRTFSTHGWSVWEVVVARELRRRSLVTLV